MPDKLNMSDNCYERERCALQRQQAPSPTQAMSSITACQHVSVLKAALKKHDVEKLLRNEH